jgi:DNA modification methylase
VIGHTLVCGNAQRTIQDYIKTETVNCVVTSPPYWQQRHYGGQDEIGREEYSYEYVLSIVRVFRQLHRVLTKDGTVWLNIGDVYRKKSLMGIPWKVADALMDEGWLVRSDIIWHKPNAMPESAKDRPTQAHEHVFLLTKGEKYYYNGDAVREPAKWERWGKQTVKKDYRGIKPIDMDTLEERREKGKNRRNVWTLPTARYPGAHFAVMPDALVELCLKAGCPEGGAVLDPFVGSGTVCAVAKRMGLTTYGIDTNPEYIKLASERIHGH